MFLLLAALWYWRHKPYYPWALWPGAGLFAFGTVWPAALRWVYLAWMSLAVVMGFIVSTVLLLVFFYLVVTPVGLLAKCFGKDFLNRKLEPAAASYWILRDNSKPRTKAEYEQQF
ncbi:MAG: sxtJ [Verrucomicrobia bacterium]|nr:sxtJ [Verrucomicrobiota bacterium]